MIAHVLSAALIGIEAALVRVEVDVASGLPIFTTVGLPDSAVRESRERVRTAIRNAGYAFPSDRITVNLAPAGLRKEGPAFDLPIALGILTATGSIHRQPRASFAVVGELALNGQIRAVRGALAVGLTCRRKGVRTLLVPQDNAQEVMAVEGVRVIGAETARRSPSPRAPRRPAPSSRTSSTSPMSGARPTPSAPSRSPPPARTTCCSWDRLARARRCWPGASPRCFRR
jgi:hypothetical protein